jgi:putative thioredoxin
MKSGEAALAEKDFAGAAEVFAHILAEDSSSIPALAGLARSHVGAGNIEQAKRTLDLVPQAKHNDAAYLAAKAAIELAEQASNVGPVAELEAKVAANPADHQSRFDLAVALNAAGNRDSATNHLLEIVKRDRKWNDDGARKQLVQLFDAWGPTDDATVEGRRRLSSILFA